MSRRTSGTGVGRYLPVSYAALAIVLVALLLPTILRPPQDLQSSTAAFSPDAPPDDSPPEALLQTLRQASSSTAGASAKEQAAAPEPTAVMEEAPPPPPPPPKKPAKGKCFGDPPRQTESVYSALCVPAFTGGDNGGATAPGITAEEIRIGIMVDAEDAVPQGRLDGAIGPTDNEPTRQLKAWQIYFNERFEFHGRRMQFYVRNVSGTDDEERSAIKEMKNLDDPFAAIGPDITLPTAAAANEAIKQKMVTFLHGANPPAFYRDNHPYVFSFDMDSGQVGEGGFELICKQWVGKPPGEINNRRDITFDYTKPRVWGLVLYQDEIRTGAKDGSIRRFRQCGGEWKEILEFNLTDAQGQSNVAGIIARMKAAQVTTIVLGVDPYTPALFTVEAERANYSPEWIGVTGVSNQIGRFMDDNQAPHYVRTHSEEIPRIDADKDWYRAYKEVDPEGEPTSEYFRSLQQLSGGIQLAGTQLTPESFWQGLTKNPCRAPDPIWSIGGCYRNPDPTIPAYASGDFTYSDFQGLAWFDQTGKDPDSTVAGAWCHMHLGRRYRLTEFPTEPLPLRDKSQCITTPERGVQG